MKAFFLGLTLTFGMTLGALAADELKIVANDKTCMVTNAYFGKKQIPVQHEGKTYYGCCENCKKTLQEDAKARMATDPVSGETVDKATAVIAARDDDTVIYFANKKNFEAYSKKSAAPPEKTGTSETKSESESH